MSKEERLIKMGEIMNHIWSLDNNGLLSTTDMTMLLDRVRYKYKLSPLKYFPRS